MYAMILAPHLAPSQYGKLFTHAKVFGYALSMSSALHWRHTPNQLKTGIIDTDENRSHFANPQSRA